MTLRRAGKTCLSFSLFLILCFPATLSLAKRPPTPSSAMPKNVILMISDGQGYNSVQAADYFGEIPVYESEDFTAKYGVSTYPFGGSYDLNQAWASFNYVTQGSITDSAAAATAMATGVKTKNGYLGVNSNGQTVKNIVETASGAGKATGVVTSVEFSHATPAGMAAHTTSRDDFAGIANQMLTSDLDVIMGAGHPYYNDNGDVTLSRDYKYVGGDTTWAQVTTPFDGQLDEWTFIETKDQFLALANGSFPSPTAKLVGVAQVRSTLQEYRGGDTGAAPFVTPLNDNVPTLEVMAQGALQFLSQGANGFFLMVEGGAVDWAGHSNRLGRMIEEESDFNDAVQAVVDWVEANSDWNDTLLIVTADHETGHLWGPGSGLPNNFTALVNNGAGYLPGAQYYSTGHTNALVPLCARGKGAELFSGYADQSDPRRGLYVDNTEIFAVMTGKAARVKPGKGGKAANKTAQTSFEEAVGF
jgi:alkaline phosphatase